MFLFLDCAILREKGLRTDLDEDFFLIRTLVPSQQSIKHCYQLPWHANQNIPVSPSLPLSLGADEALGDADLDKLSIVSSDLSPS